MIICNYTGIPQLDPTSSTLSKHPLLSHKPSGMLATQKLPVITCWLGGWSLTAENTSQLTGKPRKPPETEHVSFQVMKIAKAVTIIGNRHPRQVIGTSVIKHQNLLPNPRLSLCLINRCFSFKRAQWGKRIKLKPLILNGGLLRVFHVNVQSLRRGYIMQCFSNLSEQRTPFNSQSLWQE